MKYVISFLFFCFSFQLIAQTTESQLRYIDVTGTAELEIIPDEIFLRIVLSEEDNKDKKPLSKLEKTLLSTLESLGIPLSNLSVDDAASFFHKSFFSGKEIYTQKTYELLIRNAASIGKVLEELEKAGLSNITLKSVDHSKMEEFKKKVKIDAAKAAKEKAKYMLEAIGEEVGKAIYIKETDTFFRAPQYANKMMMLEEAGSESDKYEINFRKIIVRYSVNARFEIK